MKNIEAKGSGDDKWNMETVSEFVIKRQICNKSQKMENAAIREKLHEYIDTIDEKKM